MQHHFQVEGRWQGGQAGNGSISAEHVSTTISLPAALGGSAKGTNPEEMLLGTAAACYLATLAIALEKRGIHPQGLRVQSTGTLDVAKLRITQLVHEPRIQVAIAPTPEQKLAMAEAVHKAEQICLISKAIRGNVEVEVRWDDEACEIAR